jgi:hypothetical protein
MIEAILTNDALKAALYLLLATALVDLITGVYGAWAGGTFNLKYLDAFIPEHILKRILPILITGIASVTLTGDAASVLFAAFVAEVAAYEAATVKSVLENLAGARVSATSRRGTGPTTPAPVGNVPDAI